MGVLGDGDSKAHNELIQRRVYGDEQVTKLDCVGHSLKRMGSCNTGRGILRTRVRHTVTNEWV